MNDKFLHRDDAPFERKVWDALDETVAEMARSRLSGRKLLDIEGPFGLGLRTIPMQERTVRESGKNSAGVMASTPWPLAFLHVEFQLPTREIAAFEEANVPMNPRPAIHAAFAIAQMEDDLIFNGSKEMGVNGLLTVSGKETIPVSGWENVGVAADTVIKAITALDSAGFQGPYTLALSPSLYNLLLRRYPQGDMTELQHIGSMVAHGIYKAPAIGFGGVLLASGKQYASLMLGQDITTGFIGPEGNRYTFSISESMFLRIDVPEAICILTD